MASPPFPPPARAGDPVDGPGRPGLIATLGPGLVTGIADDDPSGIATYAMAGAQLGFGALWMMLFAYPLMVATQEISARLGRTTGQGLAGSLRQHYSAWLVQPAILLLVVANVINLGADIGAMGASAALAAGGPEPLYVVLFGALCIAMQVLLRYSRIVTALKWLSLTLLAYFGTLLTVRVPWGEVLYGLVVPTIHFDRTWIGILVAVLGTTISPYLFFWQSAQEAEEHRVEPRRQPLLEAPHQAPRAFERIRLDTCFGMAVANLVALAIMITTASTLHTPGAADIATAADAAAALAPVAGRFAAVVFALGIIGTGFLSIPALAGSAAYAIGEARRWPVGMARRPMEARAFYGTLAMATAIGTVMNFLPVDPIQALYWAAIINGVLAAPMLVLMMCLAGSRKVMGPFTLSLPLGALGWLATVVMAATALALIAGEMF